LVLVFLLTTLLISLFFLLTIVDILSVMLHRVFLKLGDDFLNRLKHLLRLVDSKLQ
jgi:UDP-N-acetylmuramyl pentapeptide phosphotransferase/UDP-N-acetylglucosamine-1-phosphate transferase